MSCSEITTNYPNFSREDNILLIGVRVKRNTERHSGYIANYILKKEFYHLPDITNTRYESAPLKVTYYGSVLLHLWDH